MGFWIDGVVAEFPKGGFSKGGVLLGSQKMGTLPDARGILKMRSRGQAKNRERLLARRNVATHRLLQ
jgi:hypothetical protein